MENDGLRNLTKDEIAARLWRQMQQASQEEYLALLGRQFEALRAGVTLPRAPSILDNRWPFL